MERFIEKLKRNKTADAVEQVKLIEKEKTKATNPCIACCITMGKEPHAGHMFLLAIAEQVRSASTSKLPIVVINNNTGPRAAAAVVAMSESKGLPIDEVINKMDIGEFDTREVVRAYRSRRDEGGKTELVAKMLVEGGRDVFSVIASETETVLKRSGFEAEILSESALNKIAVDQVLNKNSEWSGSGFVPYTDNKRLVILQRSGNLTASGSMLTSLSAISKITDADLVLVVDSMPDIGDVAYVMNKSSSTGGLQVPGAGVGFDGRIASGTKGEALSIKDISSRFYLTRPKGNLKKAVVFLTMTMPLSFPVDSLNIADSFYDFKDNDSLLESLTRCNDEVLEYKQVIAIKLNQLITKTSDNSFSKDSGTGKFLTYLPQRLKSLIDLDPEKFVSESKKVDMISVGDRTKLAMRELGYKPDCDSPYDNNERLLGVRRNSYFSSLNGLLKAIDKIDMISPNDLGIINKMVELCLERIGI